MEGHRPAPQDRRGSKWTAGFWTSPCLSLGLRFTPCTMGTGLQLFSGRLWFSRPNRPGCWPITFYPSMPLPPLSCAIALPPPTHSSWGRLQPTSPLSHPAADAALLPFPGPALCLDRDPAGLLPSQVGVRAGDATPRPQRVLHWAEKVA